mgnify:CR=1 FL=1
MRREGTGRREVIRRHSLRNARVQVSADKTTFVGGHRDKVLLEDLKTTSSDRDNLAL